MKKICITLELLIIILMTIACGTGSSRQEKTEYLRIHIRANSNSEYDQSVKYKIRDDVVPYLTPYLANCHSKDEAADVITQQKEILEKRIDGILKSNGYGYSSSVKIRNEKFPTRVYGELTLDSGYYDAVIVELGKAEGDNWWCVVYPPLCFTSGENVKYRSKIAEIIAEWKKKRTQAFLGENFSESIY